MAKVHPFQVYDLSPADMVQVYVDKLERALNHAGMDISIETIVDPLTRESRREIKITPLRDTPEFHALLEGTPIHGYPIRRGTCDHMTAQEALEGVASHCFIPSEDKGWLHWATKNYYYPSFCVFSNPVPPAWATHAVYFSK